MKTNRELAYRARQSAINKIESSPRHKKRVLVPGGYFLPFDIDIPPEAENRDVEKLARKLMGRK